MVVDVVRIESQVHNVTVACPILAHLSSAQGATTTSSDFREPAHQIWALCKADVQVKLLNWGSSRELKRRCRRHTKSQKWVSSILDKLRKGSFMNNVSMSFTDFFVWDITTSEDPVTVFCPLLVFSGLILIGGICCGPGFSRRCDLAFEPRIRWILLSSVSRTPLHPFPFAMMALPMLTL